MQEIINQLVERLALARDDKNGLSTLIDHSLKTPFSLTPWTTWTLLCLIRHQKRQQWLAEIIQYRLNADLEAMAQTGSMGHPDGPQTGLVPGLTDWEYYFHGTGCCLTHRGTGEAIDVDFFDETADWLDEFFFVRYLESLKSPEYAERRLLDLHPSVKTVVLAWDELVELGLLERQPRGKAVRLGFPNDSFDAEFQWIESVWKDKSQQLRIAIAMGDWILVEKLSDDSSICNTAQQQVVALREARSARLVRLFESDNQPHLTLLALGEIESTLLHDILSKVLSGPPAGTVSMALKVIFDLDDAEWCPPLYRLMNRIDPNGELPQPHIWIKSAEFLLKHRYRFDEILQQLPRADRQSLAEAAVLALEHGSKDTLQLFRRALRSSVPLNRIVASAVLAIVDQPWCRQELVRVLEESSDYEQTAECRAALIECHSTDLHQLVLDWEARNPYEPEASGRYTSMKDLMIQQAPETIRWEMQSWHDRGMKLRTVPPPVE